MIVSEKVEHGMYDKVKDLLFLRAWPVLRTMEAGPCGKKNVPRNPGGGLPFRIVLGKGDHGGRPRAPEERPVAPLHLRVFHYQYAKVRPLHRQDRYGPSDESTEKIPVEGNRPDVLPDADPEPGG